jgi:hypothetical protein
MIDYVRGLLVRALKKEGYAGAISKVSNHYDNDEKEPYIIFKKLQFTVQHISHRIISYIRYK